MPTWVRTRLPEDRTFALYLLTIATIPITRPALFESGWTPVQASDIFVALTYLAWVAQSARARVWPPVNRLLVATLVFIGALGVSVVNAGEVSVSTGAKLAAYSAFLLLPWLSPQLVTDEKRLQLVVQAWLIGTFIALAVAVAGIAWFYLVDRDVLVSLGCSYGRLDPGAYPRVCIPFRNPNMFVNYLTVSVPLLLAAGHMLLTKRLLHTSLALCGLIAIATFSTGIGGFSLAVVLTVLGLRAGSAERRTLKYVALAAAGIGIALMFAIATIGHLVPEGQGQLALGERDFHFLKGSRTYTWLNTVGTIKRNPVTGVGYGSLVARTPPDDLSAWFEADMLEPVDDTSGPLFAEAHNAWLSVTAQAGVIGLVAFLWLVYELMRRASWRLASPDHLANRVQVAAVAGIAGALFFHGFFAAIEEARHLWALFSLLAATIPLIERARSEERESAAS